MYGFIGFTLTVCYLLGFSYFVGVDNLLKFAGNPLNEVGDFFSGIFAPVAFLWLVLGYFQNSNSIKLQSQDIKLSIKEMEEANKISQEQQKSLANNEMHIRRELFLKYFDIYVKEFEALAKRIIRTTNSNIYTAALGGGKSGGYTPGHGDINLMLIYWLDEKDSHKNNIDEQVKNCIQIFCSKYEELKTLSKEYDQEGELGKLLTYSSYNRFYEALLYIK